MKSRLLFFVALFALVAVVAFGAGSSHLIHGSSPVFASDPVFSGTGVQLPSDSANPAHLTGNIYFNSATGYLTFDDGTTYHSIPGLDMANTWAGVQTFGANVAFSGTTLTVGSATAYPATVYANALTAEGATPTINGFGLGTSTAGTGILGASNVFTAAQTFNGGIVFGAAGSIAGTSTFIEADGAGGNLIFNTPTGKNPIFEIAGSTVLKVVANGAGLGGFKTGGGYAVEDDGLGNLGFYYGTTESFRLSGGGALLALGGLNFNVDNSAYNVALFQISGSSGKVLIYDSINTVGLGVSPIYGSGLLVSIGTTSTTIATYTPTSATGQQFVIQWTLSAASGTTPTCTATFTDPKAGVQTVTLFSSAMAGSTVTQGSYSLVATSGSAVTMSCSALVGSDIFGTASISQYQ